MKKSLLLIYLLVGLGFLNATYGQNVPSSVKWPLTDPSTSGTGLTALTTGQVTAASENLVGLTLGGPAYKPVGSTTTIMQRMQMTGGWPASQTAKVNTVYTEYAVSPKTGFIFHVDSIALSIAALSINTVKADIYYSTDPTFSTATQIPYTTGLTVGSSTNVLSVADFQRVKISSLGLALNPGQTLYVRVYPWVEGLAATTTGKYLLLSNIVVGGEVESLSVPSSIVWPCATDLTNVVTGNLLAGTPTFGAPLVKYGSNLAYGGITGVSIYTNAIWQPETAPVEGRYMQFTASPKTGGTFTVDSISLQMAAWYTTDFRVSIYYSKDPNFTLATGTALVSDVPVTNAAFSKTKSALSLTVNSGETIYFRLYPYHLSLSGDKNKLIGLNKVSIYGGVTGVTADPPTLTTNSITYISSAFGTSGGNVTSDGGANVTERGVVWNTTNAPTIANSKAISGAGTGSFSLQIKGLTPNTAYYLRAYATNSAGTSYGNEQTFTTLATIIVPTVTKTAASAVMVKWANAGGNATAWGGDTIKAKGVCWNTIGNPTISDNKTVNGTDLGSFNSIFYPLVQNTKYYFRAYATNSAGTGYSVVDSLTTQSPMPDVTKIVAKNGSGDYTNIQDAFNAVPDYYPGRWIIRVKPGTYKEKVTLASSKVNVYLIGIHPDSTILTYDAYAGQSNGAGGILGTNNSFSVAIDANDFMAQNITFQNTIKNDGTNPAASGGEQAVALRTKGDRQQYYNCKLKGYQDTYYTNSNGRIYMKNCYIEGSVDFIFGNAVMVLDNCETYCNREGGTVTAASTDASSLFGYVFLNSKLSSLASGVSGFDNKPMVGFSLGRPWQNAPRTVFITCDEPATLLPAGWLTWNVIPGLYGEYKCTGSGSATTSRLASISRQLTDLEAPNYTISNIFAKTTSPSYGFDWMPNLLSDQSIAITNVTDKKYGAVFALPATGGNSGNAITLTSLTPTIASVAGNNVTVIGVGTAKIKASQAGNDNYLPAIDSVKTFKTVKADLTAKADDVSKKHGEANPTFTISYTGFVNGDTKANITEPIASSTATASSVVGTYPITLSGGSATNYNIIISATNGTLTITPGTPVNNLAAAEIIIYPNPASNVIKIKRASSKLETLSIFDMNGSKIIEKKLVSDLEDIDITQLSRGTYMIRLEGMMYKLVVQ